MSTRIKICGLSTNEAIEASIVAGADYLGFIFFEKSPRHISLEQACELSQFIDNRIDKIAVSVNASDEQLDKIVESLSPNALQLHGSENPGRVNHVKSRYNLPVIKALPIRDASDLDSIDQYKNVADKILFDAKPPEGSDLPGGNAISFDWNLLNDLDESINYMLSGGLDTSNILDALRLTNAKAVDISSGVESSPGVKDIAKIKAFIKTIRDYDETLDLNA